MAGRSADDGKITLESEMDVEPSAAIDRVSDRIHALDVSVNDRIDALVIERPTIGTGKRDNARRPA